MNEFTGFCIRCFYIKDLRSVERFISIAFYPSDWLE